MPEKTPIYGLLAEFQSADAVVFAAQGIHRMGYRRAEAYTPFPVDGLAEALGFRDSLVAPLALMGGLVGASAGFFMCWYANVVSYPWNVGGRPNNSWPAWIPITFELTVLLSGLSAAIGMLVLNGLPRMHHPVFNAPEFVRASRDRFFIEIEASDPMFDLIATRQSLEALGAQAISLITLSEVERA
jgi:hypothetical protein